LSVTRPVCFCFLFWCLFLCFVGRAWGGGGGEERGLYWFVLYVCALFCVERLVLLRLRSCGSTPVHSTRIFLTRLGQFLVSSAFSFTSRWDVPPSVPSRPCPMPRPYIVLHACYVILWFFCLAVLLA